jgi:hypothetical protein
MGKRLVCKAFLAGGVGLAVLCAGAGAVGTAATQAGAASAQVGKKSPPKKHPSKKSASEAKKLKELGTNLKAEKGATFEASYAVKAAGRTQSVTFAQAPPKFLFKTQGGEVIYTGSETLFCASSSSCVGTGTTDPLASLLNLFSPTTARTFFDQAEVEIGARKAGYSVSFSSGTYGGLASECAKVSGHGHSGRYCVAKNGLFTYGASSTGNSITLTSYTANVPHTAFTPPNGASISTIPSM